jgi:hypothetical protein
LGESENKVLEDLKLKIESSSRSSEVQSSKIDELAEKIEVLENKEKELESENEKLRMGFQDVIFENSIAHALLMQNVRSVQDRVKTRRLFFGNGAKNALFFFMSRVFKFAKTPEIKSTQVGQNLRFMKSLEGTGYAIPH